MKIFLSGAHGVGKTTINNELIQRLRQLNPNTRQLDSITSEFVGSKESFKDPHSLMEFQTRFTIHCLEHYINSDDFVSSRYLADMYAYCKYEYDRGHEEYKMFMDLLLHCAKHIGGFVAYIYVPIMFDIEGTNIRSKNKDFQKEIDKNIKEFFEKTQIKYYTIKTLDRRVDEILDYVYNEVI